MKCKTCGDDKRPDDFPKRGGKPNAWKCDSCSRAYKAAHYYANKPEYLKRIRKQSEKRRAHTREIVERIKATPCADCGVTYPPYVMQFDHVRGEKTADVAKLYFGSIERLLEEIEKCEVVCANCHAIRTHKRRVSSKGRTPLS